MAIQTMNPAGLMTPQGYAQVAVATGGRTVYLAGQTAQDAEGNMVGVGDLAAQAEQAWINVATALEAAGATFADVAKTTMYVADWKPEKMEALFEGTGRVAARLGIDMNRPVTLIGVETLFSPDILVELDVTAVLD